MVRLSHGRTHVRDDGPQDGPVIVLVHGLTTPSFVFDGLVPDLVARGHRVIRYDHYGRGLSDRPRIPQSAEVFRQHLNEVLDACGVTTPVTLLGYSMGGAVITDFAAQYPERVSHLILVAPAGLHAPLTGVSQAMARLPLLGDWLFYMTYPRKLRRGIEEERALPSSFPGLADRALEELRYRGYLRLVLASLRGLLKAPLPQEHARIAEAGLKVTAVFGKQDPLIPMRATDQLRVWNPSAKIVVLKDAGHGLPYTHSAELLAAF